MQKVTSYLYPNRIILLADLAGFTVENTIVYQRTVKIYQGVDNVIEFDIQNADQKRLELNTSPVITDLTMHVMDEAGNALPTSPYTITPNSSIKGIASAVIPSADLAGLNKQFLKFTITATKDTHTIPLYADSYFGAPGTMELFTNAMPVTRPATVYDKFVGEIDFMGNVIYHSSAIPAKFYEAVPTQQLNFSIQLKGFTGTVYLEATEDMTISVESWRNSPRIQSTTVSQSSNGVVTFNNIDVGNYNYFRISWTLPTLYTITYGALVPQPQTVSSVTVTS
jgi:hypothetical protein